jgi:class 3 adenylate cyclase
MVNVETRYAVNGASTIAYQVMGSAPTNLLYIPGWFFNPEIWGDFAPMRRYFERLQSFARVVAVEKRGFGMSDRLSASDLPRTSDRVGDITAVADAEGLERTAIMGTFEGGALALLWAAANPQRVSSIVLIHSFGKLEWDRSIFGRLAGHDRALAASRLWEMFTEGRDREFFYPSLATTPQQAKQIGRLFRMEANPRVIEAWVPMVLDLDARSVLREITVKVLVVHSQGDAVVDFKHAIDLANQLPNAELVTLRGADHVPWGANFDAVLNAVEEFLTGSIQSSSERGITHTIVFTDIVESTKRLAESGDERWRLLIEKHDQIAAQLLEGFGGRFVKSTGDGLLADLPSPAAAIGFSEALTSQLSAEGIQIRVGVHTGKCEMYGDDLVGLAVNVAARIMAIAHPGEILVSEAVRQSLGTQFFCRPRGEHELKGVPGAWCVYTVD